MSSLTRRQFLRLISASSSFPFLASCRETPGPSRVFAIPGEIVNPSPVPGHLLRTRYQLEDFPAPQDYLYDAVVVGGGMSGLCAAWKLRQAGVHKILLLELEEEVGGTCVAGFGNGTAFPWGAHYINIPPAEADCIQEVLEDLGVIEGYDPRGWPRTGENHLLRWPRERLFDNQSWVEELDPFAGASKGEAEVLRQFEDDMLRWTLYRDREGRRAFAMPLLYSTQDPEVRQLDTLTMEGYLRSRGWNSRRLDWLVNYACRDDYGSLLNQVSAWAGIHYFACRFYDRRVRHEYPSDTLTWPEGNAFLIRGLAGQLKSEQYRTRSLVLRAGLEEDGVRIGFVELESGEFNSVKSRTVVYAAKLHTAPYVIADLPARQARSMTALEYSPWLVAAIQVGRRPDDAPVSLAWDNVLFDSPSTGYVVADHQTPPAMRNAPTVLVYYLPFAQDVAQARRHLLERGHEFWVERIMRDLLQAHPDLEDLVERIDIYRWGHAMVRPAPGTIWGKESQWRRARFGPIFFATCDATGLPLFEEACFAGIHAAEQSLSYLGASFQTSLKGMPDV